MAMMCAQVRYDPSHREVRKRAVWRYRIHLDDAAAALRLGLSGKFWDSLSGADSRCVSYEYNADDSKPARQKTPLLAVSVGTTKDGSS
jgi:hypothetical protein